MFVTYAYHSNEPILLFQTQTIRTLAFIKCNFNFCSLGGQEWEGIQNSCQLLKKSFSPRALVKSLKSILATSRESLAILIGQNLCWVWTMLVPFLGLSNVCIHWTHLRNFSISLLLQHTDTGNPICWPTLRGSHVEKTNKFDLNLFIQVLLQQKRSSGRCN